MEEFEEGYEAAFRRTYTEWFVEAVVEHSTERITKQDIRDMHNWIRAKSEGWSTYGTKRKHHIQLIIEWYGLKGVYLGGE